MSLAAEGFAQPSYAIGSLWEEGDFAVPKEPVGKDRHEESTSAEGRVLVHDLAISALRRLVLMGFTVVPVAFLSSVICYGLLYLSPFNVAEAILGEGGSAASIHKLALQLGTNRSYFSQYWTWLKHTLSGNLGISYYNHVPVVTSIAQKLPVDLSITALALVIGCTVGLGAGVVAALNRGRLLDRVVTGLCSVAHTIPSFWFGILLLIVFAVDLRMVPALGYTSPSVSLSGWFGHAIIPALSLALVPSSAVARQTRTALVGALAENFIVGARVRGLRRGRVLVGHALRYALGPAITVIGVEIPALIGGAVVIEQVFGLPGIGQFAVQSAQNKDMPAIQGVLMVLICIVLASNVIVNVVLGWLRPEAKG